MKYNAVAYEYEQGVLDGTVVAGELLKLAVERQRRDLKELSAKGYYFDHDSGQHILDYFELLNIGPNTLFKLFPFNLWELYVFYGWKKRNGKRRFTTRYKSCSRKNAKTPLESGQILYHLQFSELLRAEAYISATKEEQAKIAFNDALSIIENSPEIKDSFVCTSTTIFCPETKAKFQFLTSNPKTADGSRPSYFTIDEHHEFDNDDMYTKLITGTINRDEFIASVVTTRGSKKEGYPCYENERRIYIPILKNDIKDESTFAVIYSQDSEDEFDRPETWGKSNPMANVEGGVLDIGKLIEARDKAILKGEEAIVGFKTLNLNWWCDAPISYITDTDWRASVGAHFEEREMKGRKCWLGLDMSRTDDFCAAALLFPPEDWKSYEPSMRPDEKSPFKRTGTRIEGEFRLVWRFWIPKHKFEQRIANGMYLLREWEKKGYVKLIDSNAIDPRVIEEDIKALSDEWKIEMMAYDRYNATSTALALQEFGIDAFQFPQTMPFFAEPTRDFKTMVLTHKLNHNHNPVATWMMRNAVPISDTNGNTKITKDPKRAKDKVDGVVAAIMALGAWMAYENTKESIYNTMELRSF